MNFVLSIEGMNFGETLREKILVGNDLGVRCPTPNFLPKPGSVRKAMYSLFFKVL